MSPRLLSPRLHCIRVARVQVCTGNVRRAPIARTRSGDLVSAVRRKVSKELERRGSKEEPGPVPVAPPAFGEKQPVFHEKFTPEVTRPRRFNSGRCMRSIY